MRLKEAFLSPVLVAQALWVMTRAARLPEPEGPRSGRLGQGRPLRLLILGDSSAAGVGTDHQDQALAGRLTTDLALDCDLSWQLVAQSGATTASAMQLLDAAPKTRFDIALVCLGVNDAKNGMSHRAWVRNYAALLNRLEKTFGVQHVFVSGLPPVRHFPLLPRPLCNVLGDRAEAFNASLKAMADDRRATEFMPLDVPLNRDAMAPDGFHPGPEIYAEWAAGLARIIRSHLANQR